MTQDTSPQDGAKRAAGEAAALLVEDGMRVGLGTGSTMRHVVAALGRRALRIVGVPTSVETETQARALGIALDEPNATPIDLAIDGADEVEIGTLRLIKGLGGALLREKIVARSSRRFVIVADASKKVARLGDRAPLPVEVARYGHLSTAAGIAELGGAPRLRMGADGAPFVTDGGNLVYDCAGFAPILDPFTLERALHAIAGVVETGLFLMRVEQVVIATESGAIEVLR